MFGKIFSVVSGIALIYSYYIPWYDFGSNKDITPNDVFQTILSQNFTTESIIHSLSLLSILILGGLLVSTLILHKIFLSLIKTGIAVFLIITHVSYFYSSVIKLETPFEWIKILQTSLGFILFLIAMALYFLVILFAIILSPVKGLGKLIGI